MKFVMTFMVLFFLSGCGQDPETQIPVVDMSQDMQVQDATPDIFKEDMSDISCTKKTWYEDKDGDTFGGANKIESCEQPELGRWVSRSGDCNDKEEKVHPSSIELCNGRDDTCDGKVDPDCDCIEGETQSCGSSQGVCTMGTQRCMGGDWGSCEESVSPKEELCNGLDDDCDGETDEGCDCTHGDTQDCGNSTGSCQAGTQHCILGTWGTCQGGVGPQTELCNGLDDDCDGEVDEDAQDAKLFYLDVDKDGYGDLSQSQRSCNTPLGSWVEHAGDCDDMNPKANPSVIPQCGETLDLDCNGQPDEDQVPKTLYFPDNDKDGFGDDALKAYFCAAPVNGTTVGGDCDDTNPRVFPGQTEMCNGVDDDCNGNIDADAVDRTLWYKDLDQDTFVTNETLLTCEAPLGYGPFTKIDQCPTQPEDFNGIDDEDGCPDGALDADNDGVMNSNDLCPNVSEDVDGYEDADGCPEVEVCDVNFINGTCQSLGFDKGTLTCANGQHDTSACANYICGDGQVDPGEQCDTGNQNGQSCNPAYGASCTYCTSSCQTATQQGGSCGDGVLDTAYEACEVGVNTDCVDIDGNGQKDFWECQFLPNGQRITNACVAATCQVRQNDPNLNKRGQPWVESWVCYDEECGLAATKSQFKVEKTSDLTDLRRYLKLDGGLVFRPVGSGIVLYNETPLKVREVESLAVFMYNPVPSDSYIKLYDFDVFSNLRTVNTYMTLSGENELWSSLPTDFKGFDKLESVGTQMSIMMFTYDNSTSYQIDLKNSFGKLTQVGTRLVIIENGNRQRQTGICQNDALAMCLRLNMSGSACLAYSNYGICN